MKKKYKIISNKIILTLIFVILIILLCGLIVNLINLYNAIKSDKGITIPILWIVSCCIELAIILFLCFNRHFTLTDKCLVAVQGVFYTKIPYEDLLLIREDAANAIMLLYYKVYKRSGEELINYRAIPIKHTLYDEFIADIRRCNPNVSHENFDKSKKTNYEE